VRFRPRTGEAGCGKEKRVISTLSKIHPQAAPSSPNGVIRMFWYGNELLRRVKVKKKLTPPSCPDGHVQSRTIRCAF
jgi:hypothetical protein